MLLQSFLELPEQQHFPPLSRRDLTPQLGWDLLALAVWHQDHLCFLQPPQLTKHAKIRHWRCKFPAYTPPKANFWSVGIPLDAVPCPRRPDPEAVRAAGKGHGVLGFQRDPGEGEAAACDGAWLTWAGNPSPSVLWGTIKWENICSSSLPSSLVPRSDLKWLSSQVPVSSSPVTTQSRDN